MIKSLKKIGLFLILCFPLHSYTQPAADTITQWNMRTANLATTPGKNIVKVNLSSLAFKNYHLVIERQIGRKFSAGLGFRYGPEGNIPFKSYLDQIINDPDITIDSIESGNIAITPEIRWYPGRKNSMQGFYLSLYGRYSQFTTKLPVRYSSTIASQPVNKQAFFDGPVTALSGGLMMGVQYTIGKRFTIDLWLLGAHFGNSKGDLNVGFDPALTPNERQSLQQALDNVESNWFTIKGNIRQDGSGGTMDIRGIWGGLRAGGICAGIRF